MSQHSGRRRLVGYTFSVYLETQTKVSRILLSGAFVIRLFHFRFSVIDAQQFIQVLLSAAASFNYYDELSSR
jgi:hypothetical protein